MQLMRTFSLSKFYLIFLITFFSFALKAETLPLNNNLPIYFTAGTIEWDQITHKGIFKDQVSFKQGTTELYASSGKTIGNENNQFDRVFLYGEAKQQAHFISMPNNQNEVHAYADKMIYLPKEHLIQLLGHVYITQGKFQFRAPYVQYDLEKKKVISKSSAQERTSIIIKPEPKS